MKRRLLLGCTLGLVASLAFSMNNPEGRIADDPKKDTVRMYVTLYQAIPGSPKKGRILQRLAITSVIGETVPYEYSDVPNPYMNPGVDPRAGNEFAVLKLTSSLQDNGQVILNVQGDVKLDGRVATLDKRLVLPKEEPIYVISPNPPAEKGCKENCKQKFVFEFSAKAQPLQKLMDQMDGEPAVQGQGI